MSDHYDAVIGYSPLDAVNREKMLQVIRVNLQVIRDHYSIRTGDRILVAGAGLGDEAELIQRELNIDTIGVDLNIEQHSAAGFKGLSFQKQDLMALGFRDDSFDLIYCYHVLEHVPDHVAVLKELSRVLRSGGLLFIGFPNRNRLVSYVGMSQDASLLDKVRWNLNDYGYRLRGRFENRFGAHAGFSQKEFMRDASGVFSSVLPVRDRYMMFKYPRWRLVIRLMMKMGLVEFMYPSNYYICAKHGGQ